MTVSSYKKKFCPKDGTALEEKTVTTFYCTECSTSWALETSGKRITLTETKPQFKKAHLGSVSNDTFLALKPLDELCERYVKAAIREKGFPADEDFRNCIFEAALKFIYGPDIFKKIDKLSD